MRTCTSPGVTRLLSAIIGQHCAELAAQVCSAARASLAVRVGLFGQHFMSKWNLSSLEIIRLAFELIYRGWGQLPAKMHLKH